MRLNFKVEAQSQNTRARAGSFQALHGVVQTPVFMPVGTFGSIHAQMPEDLIETGSQIILGNTYHLWLRPGVEVFQKFKGLHGFMKWPKPILTDSGGFQIFSLPGSRKMSEEGALFQSYVDGSWRLLSPEVSIDVQKNIGSDIMMVLDQCLPSVVSHTEAEGAMKLTHRWAGRSLVARGESPQSMFGIVQGACFEDLRKISAETICAMPFDGFAIGGLAVGESKSQREDFTEFTASLLPVNFPRYLMGVGTPVDLLEAVHRGVDMFDCIIPTLYATQGTAFTFNGKLALGRGVYKMMAEPLEKNCSCRACRNFSRAYLHHIHKCNQPLAVRLLSEHNLNFYHRLMNEMRTAIFENRFVELYQRLRPILDESDREFPSLIPLAKKSKLLKDSSLGNFEICVSPQGGSIKHRVSGEVMHSEIDPNYEAKMLYVEQSGLEEKLSELENSGELKTSPLVIWDVGLGAAHNAMAVLKKYEALSLTKKLRPLELVSFEIDLDPLRLALKFPKYFSHLWHQAPHELLVKGQWQHASAPLSWSLLLGDFSERLTQAPKPDIIFYDPFSTKTNTNLWTLKLFERLADYCSHKNCSLYTYSSSTAVRAALLGASFYVAKGAATGGRIETTQAHNFSPELKGSLLCREWLEKWKRSDAKLPFDLAPAHSKDFEEKILNHRQFL